MILKISSCVRIRSHGAICDWRRFRMLRHPILPTPRWSSRTNLRFENSIQFDYGWGKDEKCVVSCLWFPASEIAILQQNQGIFWNCWVSSLTDFNFFSGLPIFWKPVPSHQSYDVQRYQESDLSWRRVTSQLISRCNSENQIVNWNILIGIEDRVFKKKKVRFRGSGLKTNLQHVCSTWVSLMSPYGLKIWAISTGSVAEAWFASATRKLTEVGLSFRNSSRPRKQDCYALFDFNCIEIFVLRNS